MAAPKVTQLSDNVATSLKTLHQRKLKAPTPLNLMVVGSPGVGKRSLLQNVFGFEPTRVAGVNPSGQREMQQIRADVGEVNVLDVEIIETAALGDHFRGTGVASLHKIIKSRLRNYALDKLSVRNARDSRIHLVLYCTPPHRFTLSDEQWVRELARYTNVAVLGCKSDALSPQERVEFKRKVKRIMNGPPRVTPRGDFGKSDRRVDALPHGGNFLFGPDGEPYCVIAVDRSYPFTDDKAKFNEPNHSDLPRLRDMIFDPKQLQHLRVQSNSLYTSCYNSGELRGPTYLNWKPYVGLGVGLLFGEGFARLTRDEDDAAIGAPHVLGAIGGGLVGAIHYRTFGKL